MTKSRPAAPPAPLLGAERPRLWTRPLRKLTEDTTFGYEAIAFSEDVLGRPLMPWQKWLFIHSLELEPGSYTYDDSPRLRFDTVVVEVARQNGKSYWLSTRALWRMFMWDNPSGDPPMVLGTAHKETAAQEIKDLAAQAVMRSPGLQDQYLHNYTSNGNNYMLLRNGARYRVEAASDDGGRGLTVTDLLFDELRQQRSWDAWAALTNATNAVPNSQTIAVTNAGEAKSVVLASLRAQAIGEMEAYDAHVAEHGSPEGYEGTSLALFEYSAPDDCGIWDRAGWAQSNPSLNHPGPGGQPLVTEKMLAGKARMVGNPGEGMPEGKYRTEVLCQWVKAVKDPTFPPEAIGRCIDNMSEIDPDSPIFLAVDTSHDRRMTHLAVAGWREDGLPHVEVILERAGTEWVAKTLAAAPGDPGALAFTPDGVVFQGKGAPASSLIDYVEDEGVTVTRCEGPALPSSVAQFSDRVMNGSVRFRDDSSLMVALEETERKALGETWVWNRKDSPVDAAPLCAVTMALWALETGGQVAEPKVSAYAGDNYERWW